jgi:predicted ATPase
VQSPRFALATELVYYSGRWELGPTRAPKGDHSLLGRLTVKQFKSLENVDIEFPRLTVLFGPNAAGKSNILDAIQTLSRVGTSRTLSDALTEPIRGYPIEAFTFPPGGLPALLSSDCARFTVGAGLWAGRDYYNYRVTVEVQPGSGSLVVRDEYLTTRRVGPGRRRAPSIEKVGDQLRIRKSKPAKPRQEPVGLNYAILSDPRLGIEYRAIQRCRNELAGWRTYYLDPRVAMRSAKSPADVRDIGIMGEDIAPFLYRLRAESPKHFEAVKRTLRSLIPSVEELTVDLDKRRGTLDIQLRQGGIDFSSRIISEGTLRVLALCAIAANPASGSLITFEEPENGVHPRRLELIAQLLTSLAMSPGRQVILTTHSPLFCDAIVREARSRPYYAVANDMALLNVRHGPEGTAVSKIDIRGPLFKDSDIAAALTSGSEDGLFESLMLRGMLDE